MAEVKEKKQKSMTYYVLKSPGKEDRKYKKLYNAQLYSYIHYDDYPTYSIYKINIVTKEELVESGENDKNNITNDKEETTMLNNKKIFKFFNKKEDPTYPEDVKYIRAELEKLGTVSCTDAELGQAWRDFSEECYCAGFLNPDEKYVAEFARWLDFDGAAEEDEEDKE